jgi:hypothetical protein
MHPATHLDAHAHHAASADAVNWLRILAIGTALTAGAIILAPYVLPLVDIGDATLATKSLNAMHGTGLGVGLAGSINSLLNAVPFVGGALAKGGLANAAATGVLGIGGVLLGNFIEQQDDGKSSIRWGKVIRYGALLTSAMIAMPAVLTGLSVGIVYLCAAFSGVALASTAVGYLADTLGAVGSMNIATAGVGGVAAALPHLLTCGLSIIPACTAMLMGSKKPAHDHAAHLAPDTRVSSVNQEMLQPLAEAVPTR